MTMHDKAPAGSRRHFLRLVGGASLTAGGLTLLSACNDGIVGAESVPLPTASTTAVSAPPTYTATDADRLNFALQIHYLLANYLKISLDGVALPAALTTGSGTLGQVSGGRAIGFTDTKLIAAVREATSTVVARVAFLRQSLGNAVTAQPAISFATGQGSPFQAFAVPISSTPPTSFYDPFASENDFLLGAIGLSAVVTSAMDELAWQMDVSVRKTFGPLTAGVAATDGLLRNVLFARAAAEALAKVTGPTTLFARAYSMAVARNPFDGPGGRDQSLGSATIDKKGNVTVNPNLDITDGTNWSAIRRSPEQALGIFYTSALSVASGGFFPAGINGTIRISGANS